MTKKRSIQLTLALILLFPALSLSGQSTDGGARQLASSLETFRAGSYQEALLGFRDILLDSSLEAYHGTAYFWIARSQMAMKNYDGAARDLEYFLNSYSNSTFYDEGMYWKGRLLFLQGYTEKAVSALYAFIESYPEHQYAANAYFWIGEALFGLGHFEKARRVFNLILSDYPESFKVEASRYRLSLIDMKEREEELMRLLRISHEEYLSALEEFQRREKAYDQAIAAYQRKLTALAADDKESLVNELNRELNEQKQTIASIRAENQRLASELEQTKNLLEEEGEDLPAIVESPSSTVSEQAADLLSIKEDALELKAFYIEWLLRQEEE